MCGLNFKCNLADRPAGYACLLGAINIDHRLLNIKNLHFLLLSNSLYIQTLTCEIVSIGIDKKNDKLLAQFFGIPSAATE